MHCDSKLKIQNTLLKDNIIDKEGNVLNITKFNKASEEITAATGLYNIYLEKLFSSKDNKIIYDDKAFKEIDKKINSRPLKYSDDMLLAIYDKKSLKSPKKGFKSEDEIKDDINFYTKGEKNALTIQKRKVATNNWLNKHNKSSSFIKNLDVIINKIHENVVQYLNIAKHSGHEGYTKVVEELEQKIVKTLSSDLSKLDSVNQLKAMLEYITFATKELSKVENRINKIISEDITFETNEEFGELKRYITDYYKNFNITSDLRSFLNEFYKSGDISEEIYNEMRQGLNLANGYMESVETQMKHLTEKAVIERFGNTQFYKVVEMKYRNDFEKQSNKEVNPTTGKKLDRIEKDQWVNKKMSEYKDEIEEKTRQDFIQKIVKSDKFDISLGTYLFNTDALTSDDLIQMLTQLMSKKEGDAQDNSRTYLRMLEKELNDIGATDEDFNAILEQDKKGNYYIKGKYNIKIQDTLKEYDFKIRNAKSEEIRKKVKDEKFKYLTSIADYDYTNKVWMMKSGVGENNISGLTDKQQKLRDSLIKVILDSHTIITNNGLRNNHESLVKYNNVVDDLEFYRLPAIEKTPFARLLDLELSKAAAKVGRQLTQIEADDIEEALSVKHEDFGEFEATRAYSGLEGKPINKIFVAYRGMIGDNQNLDYRTIFSHEVENMFNYKSNYEAESDAQLLLDLAKNSDFYVTSGVNRKNFLSIFKKDELQNFDKESGINSNVVKKMVSMIENNIYSKTTVYAGKIGNTNVDVNRVVNTFIGYSSYLTMALRIPGAAANLMNGWLMGMAESVGGEHFNIKDLTWANAEYTKHFGELLADIGSPIKKSKINQMLEYFNVTGEYSQIHNEFERKNKVTQLMKFNSLFGMYSAGEHQMQTIMMLAVLNSKKATNNKGEYIDINGNVVNDIKDASSVYDMFTIDEKTGALVKNEHLNNTSHSLITDWNKGGREDIKNLVKGLIMDAYGNYDKNRQSHIQRFWYGKLFLHYKKFLEPALLKRFRGISNSFVMDEDVKDHNKMHNIYKKTYDEQGFVTTFIKTYLRAIRQHQLDLVSIVTLKDIKEDLSNHQLANLKRAHFELVMIGTLITTAAAMAALAKANGDDDDDLLWWSAYLLRRAQNETSQFYSLPEFSRMYKNPIASYKQLNNLFNLVSMATDVTNWTDDYKTGEYKGQNKLWVKTRNVLVPKSFIFNYDPSAKTMYNFYDNPGSISW